ncbi:MAG: phospholipid carrier-dependent glycosyltransferase [Anaerolineae bacterium]|nr:phospholipid carrier-dependent glycosyltransferase [Anaerolineae bacterium]
MGASRLPPGGRRQQAEGAKGRRQPTVPDTGGGDAPLVLGVACLLFAVYLFTFSGSYHSSDEMSMLVATDSLARRGAWDIDLLRWMEEQQGSFGPDGHLYSRKGIGTTLAALPLYWLSLRLQELGNVQAAMLTNAVVTGLTGALILALLRRLGYGRGAALLAALGFGLGTMAWPYARYLFSESLAGLGLMASAYFLVRFRDAAAGQPRSGTPAGSVLLAGCGLGVALLARLNNAIVAPFLGLLLLAYLWRQYGRRWAAWPGPIALFALPVLAALAVAAWYNWLRFGSPLTTGYLPEERFATPFFEGFYGLLLSPGKGLFWYNPLLFAAVAAWPAFYRRFRAEALLAAAVVLANVAFYAPWYLWWAGHGWGPRFLVAALPFAALPLAAAFEAATRRPLALARRASGAVAAGLVLLAVLSLAVQVAGVAVDYNLYLDDVHAELGLYHPATLFDPAHSPLLRQWSYIRAANLDLAWARNGSVNWGMLLLGLAAIVVSVLGLVDALQRRRSVWTGAWLPLLLAVVALRLLLQAGPEGDVANIARAVASLERPGEAVALAESGWTEDLQNAYDGRLPFWGLPAGGQVPGAPAGAWEISSAPLTLAPVRFWAGEAGAGFYLSRGQTAIPRKPPVPPLDPMPRLGSLALLSGVEVEGRVVWHGGTLPVTVYWQALEPADVSYTVFVQLVDEEGGKAGQVDRLPCGDACPTTTWQPGDLVAERYELVVHPGAPPGRYRLIAGMYDLATGERLPVTDGGGEGRAGDYVLLTTIEVRQSR